MNPFSKLFLLYYIPLTTELIAMILHELTQRVSGIDFRSRANKVANLFSRIARQKRISKEHEDCISLLHEYLDSILQAIIGGRHASSFKRAAPLFMIGYLMGRTLIMRILILIGLYGVRKIY